MGAGGFKFHRAGRLQLMATTSEATGINAAEEKMGKLREGERGEGSVLEVMEGVNLDFKFEGESCYRWDSQEKNRKQKAVIIKRNFFKPDSAP